MISLACCFLYDLKIQFDHNILLLEECSSHGAFPLGQNKAAYCETTLQGDGREHLRYWMLKEVVCFFGFFFGDLGTISQVGLL